MIYHLSARLGYHALLWELPLQAVYALEHVHLWQEGRNTQGRIDSNELFDQFRKIRDRYHAAH